jgi:hypothetical protein
MDTDSADSSKCKCAVKQTATKIDPTITNKQNERENLEKLILKEGYKKENKNYFTKNIGNYIFEIEFAEYNKSNKPPYWYIALYKTFKDSRTQLYAASGNSYDVEEFKRIQNETTQIIRRCKN